MAIVKWATYKKRPLCLQAVAYQGRSVRRYPPQVLVIKWNIIRREFKSNNKTDEKSVWFVLLPWASPSNNVSDTIRLPVGSHLPPCVGASLRSSPLRRLQTSPGDPGPARTISALSTEATFSPSSQVKGQQGEMGILRDGKQWKARLFFATLPVASGACEVSWHPLCGGA